MTFCGGATFPDAAGRESGLLCDPGSGGDGCDGVELEDLFSLSLFNDRRSDFIVVQIYAL